MKWRFDFMPENLNNITYNPQQIEKVLNILNELPFCGINNAMKITEIVNILNTPFLKAQQEKQNQENIK
jgi:hypothetical protein